MNLHAQIAADLKQDEGWRPSAYADHLGYTTIGYGFLIDERKHGRIPREVADYWLDYEVNDRLARLDSALPWFADAPEQVQRALTNMAYQLGVSGLLRFTKTLAHIRAGEYEQAADEALRSRWADQTPIRAMRVAEWIRQAG